jgi:hypothetical protein
LKILSIRLSGKAGTVQKKRAAIAIALAITEEIMERKRLPGLLPNSEAKAIAIAIAVPLT